MAVEFKEIQIQDVPIYDEEGAETGREQRVAFTWCDPSNTRTDQMIQETIPFTAADTDTMTQMRAAAVAAINAWLAS